MDSETASSVDEQVGAGTGFTSGPDRRGKHRVLAELKRVEQEIKFLENEMKELDKTDNVSSVYEGLIHCVETVPDPLLSLTNGPVNPIWERWFEGPQDSQGCRCWIL